jgi:transcriptional regulator with XRE-family HTH domain
MIDAEINAQVGATIRKEREKLGITQEELSQRLGMSRPSITNIERGRQQLSVVQLLLFAKCLGLSPSTLLQETQSSHVTREVAHVLPPNATPKMKEWVEKLVAGRG